MFARLLWESFRRQKRRKALAGVAILMGVTVVTSMLALATSIGDHIHKELESYGANIVVTPVADSLEVNVGGISVKPATGGTTLHEADLSKLKTIFWANNLLGVSPELPVELHQADGDSFRGLGTWFTPRDGKTAAVGMHPWWKLQGAWPAKANEVVLGAALATKRGWKVGDTVRVDSPVQSDDASLMVQKISQESLVVVGIVTSGDEIESEALMPLSTAQRFANAPGAVGRVLVSAKTRPEDAFARANPETLSPKKRELWYCRPYANSIAYQIAEAIPGARAEQIRRVEQSQGQVLNRISGLMWLIGAGALVAAGFAVSAAMAASVMERKAEIGLMRSLGASRGRIAALFYAESGLLAVIGGGIGFVLGSLLASVLTQRIFDGAGGVAMNAALLPVVVSVAVAVAIAGSMPSIRSALRMDPSATLRADA
jgi:putative ABC transport system permease protein